MTDLEERTKAAFKEFYQHFPLKPGQGPLLSTKRHHDAHTVMYMVRAYWRGKMHCTKLHTRFEGHAKTFKDLSDIRAYIEARLKYNYCPVHGGLQLTSAEQAAVREILDLDDLYTKQQEEMEAAMSKSAEEQRRRMEEARDREDAETMSVLLAMEDK